MQNCVLFRIGLPPLVRSLNWLIRSTMICPTMRRRLKLERNWSTQQCTDCNRFLLLKVVADRTAFLGSLRIADLAVLKGDTQMAAEHYGRSIELARKLAEAQPDNDGRKRDLALAISKLGELNRHDDPELARQLNKESELILTKILDRNPGDTCLLYTSPSPRDKRQSRMPSSA